MKILKTYSCIYPTYTIEFKLDDNDVNKLGNLFSTDTTYKIEGDIEIAGE